MGVQDNINDIVDKHHAYLKYILPELTELINQAWDKAGQKGEWEELRKVFLDLKNELQAHMLKEEMMLFPSIRHIEESVIKKEKPDLTRHDIRESLEQMEYEHDATEDFLSRIAGLKQKIGSESEPEVMKNLDELARDLEVHIKKEETGLFPEARSLYSKATQGMLREE